MFAQQDSEEFGEVEYEPFAEALHKDHKLGRSEAVGDDGYVDTACDAAGLATDSVVACAFELFE